MPDFMSRTPGPCSLAVGDVAGHVGQRAQRIDGVEVAEQENGLGLVAPGEIDLQAVGVVFGAMDTSASAYGFEAAGEEGAHAVGGGLVVAGRFDLDEFADGLDDLLLAGFKVAEAFGPDRVGLERLGRVRLGLRFSWSTSFLCLQTCAVTAFGLLSEFLRLPRFRALTAEIARKFANTPRKTLQEFWSCIATLPTER